MRPLPKTPYRAGGLYAAAALILVAAVGLLPLLAGSADVAGALLTAGVFAFAPLVALVAGGFVGRGAGTVADGARLGAIVGTGALLGAMIGLAALGVIAGSSPAVQDLIRASEPHPEARIPYDWIAPLGAATGALVGLLSGIGDLLLATLAGLLAAALGGAAHRPATPRPAH